MSEEGGVGHGDSHGESAGASRGPSHGHSHGHAHEPSHAHAHAHETSGPSHARADETSGPSDAHAHAHEHGHDHGHEHGHAHEHDHGHEHASPAGGHRARGPASVPCFALTVSDTRTAADDTGGAVIREVLAERGHTLVGSQIVKDEPAQIRAAIQGALARGARVVITTGGTGLTSRDVTAEVVEALAERRIPGFGELFRMLSWEQVGSAAMLSRATAVVVKGGVAGEGRGGVVFALPGSPAGVRLAMERLIAPELPHLLEQLGR